MDFADIETLDEFKVIFYKTVSWQQTDTLRDSQTGQLLLLTKLPLSSHLMGYVGLSQAT